MYLFHFDTVEVNGSSPFGPTIPFNRLRILCGFPFRTIPASAVVYCQALTFAEQAFLHAEHSLPVSFRADNHVLASAGAGILVHAVMIVSCTATLMRNKDRPRAINLKVGLSLDAQPLGYGVLRKRIAWNAWQAAVYFFHILTEWIRHVVSIYKVNPNGCCRLPSFTSTLEAKQRH
jgi:hypothetical protein